jgi:hypothetical protein
MHGVCFLQVCVNALTRPPQHCMFSSHPPTVLACCGCDPAGSPTPQHTQVHSRTASRYILSWSTARAGTCWSSC